MESWVHDMKSILLWGGLLCLILLIIPITRSLLKFLFADLLTPGAIKSLSVLFLWILWLLKKAKDAHFLILKNLMTPHKIIFPTLVKKDEEE